MCFNRLSLEVAPWCLQWHKLLEITNKRPRRNIQHHPSKNKKHPNLSKTALNTMVKQQKGCPKWCSTMPVKHNSNTSRVFIAMEVSESSKRRKLEEGLQILSALMFFFPKRLWWLTLKDVWLEAIVRVCLKCDLRCMMDVTLCPNP